MNSSLLVRDIPNMEAGIPLERLYNGDKVLWTGELAFAVGENNHVEPWAKVMTQNGVECWSRLYYLQPLNYDMQTYYVQKENKE